MDSQTCEDAILEAARTLKAQGSAYPRGYVNWWPDIYDPDDVVEPRSSYVGDVDLMDLVILNWFGKECPLEVVQRRLIWARCGTGSLLAWRKVKSTMKTRYNAHRSYEYWRLDYYASLLTLSKSLTNRGISWSP